MRTRPGLWTSLACVLVFCMIPGIGAAGTIVTFEGLADQAPVGGFYNGGAGGALGISFNDRFRALVLPNAGEPSRPGVALITPGSGSSAVINIPGGFETAFSLFYSGPGNSVLIFNEPNAQGAVIAFATLNATQPGEFVQTVLTGFASPAPVPVSLTAHSILFGYVGFGAQQTMVDNLEFGPAVPEPSMRVPLVGSLAAILTLMELTRQTGSQRQ